LDQLSLCATTTGRAARTHRPVIAIEGIHRAAIERQADGTRSLSRQAGAESALQGDGDQAASEQRQRGDTGRIVDVRGADVRIERAASSRC